MSELFAWTSKVPSTQIKACTSKIKGIYIYCFGYLGGPGEKDVTLLGIEGAAVCNVPFLPEAADNVIEEPQSGVL